MQFINYKISSDLSKLPKEYDKQGFDTDKMDTKTYAVLCSFGTSDIWR